jgi:hypothetical protein
MVVLNTVGGILRYSPSWSPNLRHVAHGSLPAFRKGLPKPRQARDRSLLPPHDAICLSVPRATVSPSIRRHPRPPLHLSATSTPDNPETLTSTLGTAATIRTNLPPGAVAVLRHHRCPHRPPSGLAPTTRPPNRSLSAHDKEGSYMGRTGAPGGSHSLTCWSRGSHVTLQADGNRWRTNSYLAVPICAGVSRCPLSQNDSGPVDQLDHAHPRPQVWLAWFWR